jgi:hypothetical protein
MTWFRRPRHRWEDNLKVNLKSIWFEGVDWIQLAQDRFQWWAPVNNVANLPVP